MTVAEIVVPEQDITCSRNISGIYRCHLFRCSAFPAINVLHVEQTDDSAERCRQLIGKRVRDTYGEIASSTHSTDHWAAWAEMSSEEVWIYRNRNVILQGRWKCFVI